MALETKTNYGSISVSEDAVAALAGGVITECYGVVGMASKQVLRDGWAEMLKKENYARGVVVKKTDEGLEIDLYIIVSFGVKVSEVVQEAQKKVKYMLEKSLSLEVSAVNVFVQGVRTVA
ncbi:MAG: Asp23/Gls24 family envelope stress response protein [Solobacterium sp.]|nr:Asp23/Gls24 family envelope stress response protein [Solobacterium sp.]